MPLIRCSKNGVMGWKWGRSGVCYTGSNAKKKAIQQGLAIGEEISSNVARLDAAAEFKVLLEQAKQEPGYKIKEAGAALFPSSQEREYGNFIKNIMKLFTGITIKEIKPRLSEWSKQFKKAADKMDSAIDELEAVDQQFEEQQDRIFKEKKEGLKLRVAEFGLAVGTFNLTQFNKQMKKAVGFTYTGSETWEPIIMQSWVAENVKLIKGLTEEYRKKINSVVLTGFRNGETLDSISKKITAIDQRFATGGYKKVKVGNKTYKVKKQSRAMLIARDQVGSLNAKYTQKRNQDIGLDLYDWQTARDERVRGLPGGRYPGARPRHDTMHGKTCKWNDGSVYSDDDGKTWKSRSSIGGPQGAPGQPIECRCTSVANFKQFE